VTFEQAITKRTIKAQCNDWMGRLTLANSLCATEPRLDADTWRVVVNAIGSQLPVIITFNTRLSRYVRENSVEQTVDAAMIESVTVNPPTSSYLRLHRWGFVHNLYLSDVVSIAVPVPSTRFLDADA